MSVRPFQNCKHGIVFAFCEACNGLADEEIGLSADVVFDQAIKRTAQLGNDLIPQVDDSCGIKEAGGGSSSYYELPPDCQTLQDIIVAKDMSFTRGNIFKAAYRWDAKPSLQYNLEKIIWFAQDALNRIYAEQKRNLHGPGND